MGESGNRLRVLSRWRTRCQKFVRCPLLVFQVGARYLVDELREIAGLQTFTNRLESLGDISSKRVHSALIRFVLIG